MKDILIWFFLMFIIIGIIEIIKQKKKYKINKNNRQKGKFKPYSNEQKIKIRELKKKGIEYEIFVAKYFRNKNYEVIFNGIEKGKNDKGIDLICMKEDELILVQCKNWEENSNYKINHEKLKAFIGCCTEYINENNLFHKAIKLKFITSNNILDKSGKNFLENSKTLQYEVIQFKE